MAKDEDRFPLPRLNLGSGVMIKPEWTNFDCRHFEHGGLCTDVIGRIEDIVSIFGPDHFRTVLCAHVIEHFRYSDALKVLRDIYTIMKSGGKAILEGPDVLGGYDYWVTKKGNPREYIEMLFSERMRMKNGPEWTHRSGWTRDIMAEEMEKIGFKIVHKGIGLTHGMGPRDFRVEGIKRG